MLAWGAQALQTFPWMHGGLAYESGEDGRSFSTWTYSAGTQHTDECWGGVSMECCGSRVQTLKLGYTQPMYQCTCLPCLSTCLHACLRRCATVLNPNEFEMPECSRTHTTPFTVEQKPHFIVSDASKTAPESTRVWCCLIAHHSQHF